MELYWQTVVFVFGACIGSFLNVVIARVPKGESIVSPPSHCACGHRIAWYDNLPLLSWFLLRGRCRKCGRPYGFRYPFVEFLTGLLFLGFWLTQSPAVAVVLMVFAALIVIETFVDLDTFEIPDFVSIGGFLLGLAASAAVPSLHLEGMSGVALIDGFRAFVVALEGALMASGLILWIALLAELILRKEAMGFGDVKLMGAIGAFCGWEGAVFALFGGAVLGTVAVLLGFAWNRIRGHSSTDESPPDEASGEAEAMPGASVRVPFGPALGAGALLYLLFFEPWVTAYFGQFEGIL